MVAILSALVAFLGTNVRLRSICGLSFNARVSEVFSFGSGFVFPVLALNLEREIDPIRGASAPVASSKYVLRCSYATSGPMLEAWTVRDALKNLLHLQSAALAAAGVEVTWIEMTASRVSLMPDIDKHLAYLEFLVIA
jgi:hypothetical protein